MAHGFSSLVFVITTVIICLTLYLTVVDIGFKHLLWLYCYWKAAVENVHSKETNFMEDYRKIRNRINV